MQFLVDCREKQGAQQQLEATEATPETKPKHPARENGTLFRADTCLGKVVSTLYHANQNTYFRVGEGSRGTGQPRKEARCRAARVGEKRDVRRNKHEPIEKAWKEKEQAAETQ